MSAMTLFRPGGVGGGSIGISTGGYDTTPNAYHEQKYAINPLLWMQNVKTVGPPATELRRAATTESTYPTVAEEMSTVLSKYATAGVKTEKVILPPSLFFIYFIFCSSASVDIVCIVAKSQNITFSSCSCSSLGKCCFTYMYNYFTRTLVRYWEYIRSYHNTFQRSIS